MYIAYQLLILTKGELIGEDEAIRGIPYLYTVECCSAHGELIEVPHKQFKEVIMRNEVSSLTVKELTRKKIGVQEDRKFNSKVVISTIGRGLEIENLRNASYPRKISMRVRKAITEHFSKLKAPVYKKNEKSSLNKTVMLPSTIKNLQIDKNSVPKPFSRGKDINVFMARMKLRELLKKKALFSNL